MNDVQSTPYVDLIVKDMAKNNIPVHLQLTLMIEIARDLEVSRNRMMRALDSAASALDNAGLDWSAEITRNAARVPLQRE